LGFNLVPIFLQVSGFGDLLFQIRASILLASSLTH
jgi:hypothetical protein